MKLHETIFANLLFVLLSFNVNGQTKLEVHGHRGYRGLYPENTIVAFKEAAKIGVDYIELDVIISKDSQVVVSHEPWFNPATCSLPDGNPVTKSSKGNLHKMNYSEIRKYDCGKRGNKKFTEQEKISAYKPLLSEVILEVEQFCLENNIPSPRYNIEIKNRAIGDRNYHFDTKTTVALIKAVIKPFGIDDKILIQSFDRRCLKEIHKSNSSLKIGLLVANPRSVWHNIHKLGFAPDYYNPSIKICTKKTIHKAHAKGCKVVVWTVNKGNDVKRLSELGVDGVITDFPKLFIGRR